MIMPIKEAPEEVKAKKYDVESLTKAFFIKDSPLKRAVEMGGRPYEYRPQQAEMAEGVAHSFSNESNLCAEAPTGIGKSFAYLVPSIYYALNKHEPVLITTETINLQEQLIEKDLPLLKELLDVEFTAALAKGKANYLCFRRLRIATGENGESYLPLSTDMASLDKIAYWSESTEDGSKSALDFKVKGQLWGSICCESGNCSGPKCAFYRRCFYWKARREWDKADIIIANHALFFTDLKIKQEESVENTLLPPYSAIVFDEAHTLEDGAANHLGIRVASGGVQYFLNRLFDPQRSRGLLMRGGKNALKLRTLVAEIQDSAEYFFDNVRKILLEKDDTLYRIKNCGLVPDTLSESFGKLRKELKEYLEDEEDEDLKTELESQIQKCDYYSHEIFDFVNMELNDHVYWLESSREHGNDNVILHSAPLNVSSLLQQILFNQKFPVILTSATLSVCGRLKFYRNRTGYMNGGELVLDSPFNFKEQIDLYIPREMPAPTEKGYQEALIEQIKHFITMTHGKAFVLFTSYYMLKKCAGELEFFMQKKNINLLVQGEDKNRSAMLREFRDDTDSVIFGTTSFWTGVDVPGEALSNVMITKLPFSVPSHPLIEARLERIEKEGKNPFMSLSLPEAVLKLRQGIGRLIRSKTDKGIIVILDKRVLTKRYGKFFIDSLPDCPIKS